MMNGPIALRDQILPVMLSCCFLLGGCERDELDRKMEALCKKDGGIKVYKTVVLPAAEFDENDRPLTRYIVLSKTDEDYLGPDYRYVQKIDILIGKNADPANGEGQLSRWHSAIYQRSDNKLLAEAVSYSRSGGDGFTFGFQPSQNTCPLPRIDIIKYVFLKGN